MLSVTALPEAFVLAKSQRKFLSGFRQNKASTFQPQLRVKLSLFVDKGHQDAPPVSHHRKLSKHCCTVLLILHYC